MASIDPSRLTVIGTGETEEQAKQNAITQANINAEFEPIVIQGGSYNEGRGVYTLVYQIKDSNNSSNSNIGTGQSSGTGQNTNIGSSNKQRTALGEGNTEAEARQSALSQAYADAEFQPIQEVNHSWNEGRGIYTLTYTVLDSDDKQKPSDESDTNKKDEKVEEKKKEDAKGSTGGAQNNTPEKKLTGSYDNNTKELRSSPGYTNYVVSTGKNINGTIASSSVFKRYYSDISAEAYINGEWFEDINTISWQISQQQYPIYGYNSYIWDDLALGSRIIQGQFTINFTEPNIINKVISKGTKSTTVNNASTFEEYSTRAHQNKVAIDGSEVTYQSNTVRGEIWKPRFDIDIVFGEKEKLGGIDIMPRHIILWDCSVSSSGIGLTANGGVLVETYSFIARDFKIIS